MPLRKSRAVADAVELSPALVGCSRRTECPWPLRIFPEACPHMMSFAHLSRCRRADEISSESEVLKSTGSLPVAILELAARPAFLNAEDLSLFFSGIAWRSDLGAPMSQEARTPTGAPGTTPLRVPTDLCGE